MNAIDRLIQYFELKDIRITRFEEEYGFANGYFKRQQKRKGGLSESTVTKVIKSCPDLNPMWFILGEGKVTKSAEESATRNQIIQENIRLKKELKEAHTSIDTILKRKGVFSNDIEQLKSNISNIQQRMEELEDKVL